MSSDLLLHFDILIFTKLLKACACPRVRFRGSPCARLALLWTMTEPEQEKAPADTTELEVTQPAGRLRWPMNATATGQLWPVAPATDLNCSPKTEDSIPVVSGNLLLFSGWNSIFIQTPDTDTDSKFRVYEVNEEDTIR